MTRKLCKFSGKNSQANFRVVFYPACIETALIWQNYLQTKNVDPSCVCVSLSFSLAWKSQWKPLEATSYLFSNYKPTTSMATTSISKSQETVQLSKRPDHLLPGVWMAFSAATLRIPSKKKKQSSSTLKHTTWKQTVSENSLKSIVVNSKNINKINIPKPEQSTFLQQCPLLKVLHKSSFSVGPVGGAPIFWWFLKGEIPDLESSCRRLREPEMSQYLKWGVDPMYR